MALATRLIDTLAFGLRPRDLARTQVLAASQQDAVEPSLSGQRARVGIDVGAEVVECIGTRNDVVTLEVGGGELGERLLVSLKKRGQRPLSDPSAAAAVDIFLHAESAISDSRATRAAFTV